MWVGGGLALTVLSLSAKRAGREQELTLVRLGTFHRVGQIDSFVLVVAVFVMTAKPWL